MLMLFNDTTTLDVPNSAGYPGSGPPPFIDKRLDNKADLSKLQPLASAIRLSDSDLFVAILSLRFKSCIACIRLSRVL